MMYYVDTPPLTAALSLPPLFVLIMSVKASALEMNRNSGDQGKVWQGLYEAIFRHSSEPIAIIDLHYKYLEQNAAHAKFAKASSPRCIARV